MFPISSGCFSINAVSLRFFFHFISLVRIRTFAQRNIITYSQFASSCKASFDAAFGRNMTTVVELLVVLVFLATIASAIICLPHVNMLKCCSRIQGRKKEEETADESASCEESVNEQVFTDADRHRHLEEWNGDSWIEHEF